MSLSFLILNNNLLFKELPVRNKHLKRLSFSKQFCSCLVLLIFGLFSPRASCQNLTVSGTVTDNSTGESLILATVYDEKTEKWTTSNKYGYFSLRLPPGEKRILFSYIGYKSEIVEFELLTDTILNIKLIPDANIEEVVIK